MSAYHLGQIKKVVDERTVSELSTMDIKLNIGANLEKLDIH